LNRKAETGREGVIQKNPIGINGRIYSIGRASDKDKQIHSRIPHKDSWHGIFHNTEYPTRRKGIMGEDNHDHCGEHKDFG
jgi:hypothetical protein